MNKLNSKGFTLIELMAVLALLGVLMAMTIPNIIGITTANRTQTYAEDARKMASTAEYMLRGDSTMVKPSTQDGCVVMSLAYLGTEEFETAPYGGEYDPYNSYAVMRLEKATNSYVYYVQLMERLSDGGYRGFSLIEDQKLAGSDYVDLLNEYNSFPTKSSYKWFKWDAGTSENTIKSNVKTRVNGEFIDAKRGTKNICATIEKVYWAE